MWTSFARTMISKHALSATSGGPASGHAAGYLHADAIVTFLARLRVAVDVVVLVGHGAWAIVWKLESICTMPRDSMRETKTSTSPLSRP